MPSFVAKLGSMMPLKNNINKNNKKITQVMFLLDKCKKQPSTSDCLHTFDLANSLYALKSQNASVG